MLDFDNRPDFLSAGGSSPPPLPLRLLIAEISDRAKLLYAHMYRKVQSDWEFFTSTGWCEPDVWQAEEYDYSRLARRLGWTESETERAAKELAEAGFLVLEEQTGTYVVDGVTFQWSRIRFALTTKGFLRKPEECKPGESTISTGFVVKGMQS